MTSGFKALFFSICLFTFLEGLHHFIVAIVPSLCKVLLGPQAKTLLISGTRKEKGRNIEDVMDSPELLFFSSEILF